MKRSPVNGCACGDYCRNVMEVWLRWLAGHLTAEQTHVWREYARGRIVPQHSAQAPLPYPIQPGAY